MSRPSEPLLRWLRQQIDAQGQTIASLAEKLGRPRAELRKTLTGAAPMTVDELLALTEALELTAEQLGLSGAAAAEEVPDDVPEPAQFGNATETLFRQAFDLGVDLMFLSDASQLEGWGGPEDVLQPYVERGRELPIRLDAAYHRYQQPTFDARGVTLTLSFDRLYRCTFPWSAIRQLVFTPVPPEPEPVAPPSPPPPEKKKPTLRLVK